MWDNLHMFKFQFYGTILLLTSMCTFFILAELFDNAFLLSWSLRFYKKVTFIFNFKNIWKTTFSLHIFTEFTINLINQLFYPCICYIFWILLCFVICLHNNIFISIDWMKMVYFSTFFSKNRLGISAVFQLIVQEHDQNIWLCNFLYDHVLRYSKKCPFFPLKKRAKYYDHISVIHIWNFEILNSCILRKYSFFINL